MGKKTYIPLDFDMGCKPLFLTVSTAALLVPYMFPANTACSINSPCAENKYGKYLFH